MRGDLRFQRIDPFGQLRDLLHSIRQIRAPDQECQRQDPPRPAPTAAHSRSPREQCGRIRTDGSQRVHGFGALLHELLSRPECNGPGLLFGRLRFHEPHRRPQRGLDNRLRIGRIIFLPLEERLDVVRRDQPDPVPMPGQLPRPMMRAGTRLHRHLASRMVRHEPRELRPRQLLAEYDRPVRSRPVQLEHVLCQIDADDANFFHGCPLFHLCFQHRKCGTLRCRLGRAASTPSPKIGDDRQRHPRPRAALRRRLRARPPTPTVGTQPSMISKRSKRVRPTRLRPVLSRRRQRLDPDPQLKV